MPKHILTVNHTADRTEVTCKTCGFAMVVYMATGQIEPVNPGDGTPHSWSADGITLEVRVEGKDGEG
jgi:hypothetical protein